MYRIDFPNSKKGVENKLLVQEYDAKLLKHKNRHPFLLDQNTIRTQEGPGHFVQNVGHRDLARSVQNSILKKQTCTWLLWEQRAEPEN